MVFENEQCKSIKVLAPNLPSFSQVMSMISLDIERGNIELLLRAVGKLTFEGVIAHPSSFKPGWENGLEKNNVITSVRYEFFSAQDCSLGFSYRSQRLREFVSNAAALCNSLNLQREINLNQDKNYSRFYHLSGWIQGSVRDGLTGFFYLRDTLGKPINLEGTLSYQ
ncbi:hypothetical protein HYU08_03945 [Candidatus Woesearchaeota archaeon]|nr:hypothetical protein [Candidatus Woesearchaeota archaeon]